MGKKIGGIILIVCALFTAFLGIKATGNTSGKGDRTMKRVIAILIVVCLLLCGCQAVTPTSTEPAIESAQTTTEATEGTIKEATTEAPTEVTTTPVTEPEQTQPSKVTVYLLEKTVFCDNGYSAYFYDDAYNVNTRKDYDIENKYLGRVNFIEKDKNGMACMIWEET